MRTLRIARSLNELLNEAVADDDHDHDHDDDDDAEDADDADDGDDDDDEASGLWKTSGSGYIYGQLNPQYIYLYTHILVCRKA